MPSSSLKSSRLRSMPAAVPCEVCQGDPTGSAVIEGCRCMDAVEEIDREAEHALPVAVDS